MTKYVDELYAEVFARRYGMATIGLRYFNVFGRGRIRRAPYAAVIPRWSAGADARRGVLIYGDGETSRDFCYVANVVQANLLAATAERPGGDGQVYNVASAAAPTSTSCSRDPRRPARSGAPAVAGAEPAMCRRARATSRTRRPTNRR